MVASNDGANFIARGVSARRFFKTPGGCDDKLVRRKNQFSRKSLACLWNRFLKQARPALLLRRQRLRRRQHVDNFPFLGRANQRDGSVFAKIDMENPRTP